MDATGETRKTEKINGIDLVKFLCSVLVIAVHIYPFRDFPPALGTPLNFFLQNYLSRLAVPFFFACTGFFLFGKAGLAPSQGKPVLRTCLELLRMGLLWRLLYPEHFQHLWYLTAAAAAICLLYLVGRLGFKIPHLCLLAICLYLIGLSGDAYRGFTSPLEETALLGPLIRSYQETFRYTRNGLFMGFPFVLMGAILAHHPLKLTRKDTHLCFLASMLLLFSEAVLLYHFRSPSDCNMYLLLPPAVLFLFCLAREMDLPDRLLWPRLRKLGVLVYYLHIPVFFLLQPIHPGLNPWLFPLTVLGTLVLGSLILLLSRFRGLRWLRLLYS